MSFTVQYLHPKIAVPSNPIPSPPGSVQNYFRTLGNNFHNGLWSTNWWHKNSNRESVKGIQKTASNIKICTGLKAALSSWDVNYYTTRRRLTALSSGFHHATSVLRLCTKKADFPPEQTHLMTAAEVSLVSSTVTIF